MRSQEDLAEEVEILRKSNREYARANATIQEELDKLRAEAKRSNAIIDVLIKQIGG